MVCSSGAQKRWQECLSVSNAKRGAERDDAKSPTTKVCKDCGIEKSIDRFSRSHSKARGADAGYSPYCKPCVTIRTALWAIENPEKVAKHKADPRRKECSANRYKKNRETILAAKKIERQQKRELFRERDARRRAIKECATPKWLTNIQKAQIAELYELAGAREMQTGIKYHVDHVVPLRGRGVCGLHVPWNLQLLTEAENFQKHNRLPDELRM